MLIIKDLINRFNETFILGDKLTADLTQNLQLLKLKKRQMLQGNRHVSAYACFVLEGWLQLCQKSKRQAITVNFMGPGHFITAPTQLLQPAMVVEAITDCQLAIMPLQHIELLYWTFPQFNFILRELLEKQYDTACRHKALLHVKDKKERIRMFFEEFPDLAHHATNMQMASFLGMSRERFGMSR
jgi:CRP-like cAMP-binding protein